MTGRDIETDRDQDDVFRALEGSLPRVAPPPDLFDRILTTVAPEATVVPLRPRRGRLGSWWAGGVAAAAAAAILITIGIALRDGGPESPAARATLEARTEAGVTGQAALYSPGSEGGRLELSLRSVPASPAGHHYEVWVLPAGSDEMVSVGTFHAETTRDVELAFDLPAPGTFAAVDVSVEEDDGPEEHSEISLSTGFFG